jgi:hypothetical protein
MSDLISNLETLGDELASAPPATSAIGELAASHTSASESAIAPAAATNPRHGVAVSALISNLETSAPRATAAFEPPGNPRHGGRR